MEKGIRGLLIVLTAVALFFTAPQKVMALDISGTKTETINGRKTTTISKSMTLSSGTSIDGDLIVKGSLKLNGNYLQVSGDVLMQSDIDVEGGDFRVSGNLHQVDSALYVNGGYVQVGKNYSIEGTEKENGVMKPSYGWIKMEKDKDKLYVGGDFWARSYNSSVISAGELQFCGNVTDYRGNTIRCSGTNFANFGMAKKPVVVDLAGGASFQSIVTGSSAVKFKRLGLKSMKTGAVISGDVDEISDKLDLKGQTLKITGSVKKVSADIDLNGGKLIVGGNFAQVDPAIYFNKGRR